MTTISARHQRGLGQNIYCFARLDDRVEQDTEALSFLLLAFLLKLPDGPIQSLPFSENACQLSRCHILFSYLPTVPVVPVIVAPTVLTLLQSHFELPSITKSGKVAKHSTRLFE
jgi:hypothetical protein